MNITEAVEFMKTHHLSSLRQSTNAGYMLFFTHFKAAFDGRSVESITSEEIGQFLESFTVGVAKATRHLRYAQAKAFFNFIINECGLDIKNPCAQSSLAKQYKNPKPAARKFFGQRIG